MGNVVDLPIDNQIYHIDKTNLEDWLIAGGISRLEIKLAQSSEHWKELIEKSLNNKIKTD